MDNIDQAFEYPKRVLHHFVVADSHYTDAKALKPGLTLSVRHKVLLEKMRIAVDFNG